MVGSRGNYLFRLFRCALFLPRIEKDRASDGVVNRLPGAFFAGFSYFVTLKAELYNWGVILSIA